MKFACESELVGINMTYHFQNHTQEVIITLIGIGMNSMSYKRF
jgi:hypothetical protein